jgi:ubiquinone/menaquinone biosynthesis C-methylase UbiE
MGTFSYDRGDIHLDYDRARSLTAEAVGQVLEALARHAPPRVRASVDLGCGTGRFTGALAQFFGARVYAVDPSVKMLGVARGNVRDPRVTFHEGAAEAIPLDDGAADLVFLSMVYHHIEDKPRAFAEFARVLREDGRVAVRTPTRERLDSYQWLRFFPASREIERGRTPSAAELIETAESNGFRLHARETLTQLFAADAREYAEKICARGLSSLKAITDEEFERGAAELKRHCEGSEPGEPVYEETDLFVFRRGA